MFRKKKNDNPKLPQRTPQRVTPDEENRVNPFFTNVTQGDAAGVKLIPGVPYIWIFTAKKEVIIGLEEPARYPQAFIALASEQREFTNEQIRGWEQGNVPVKYGHPTLAIDLSGSGAGDTKKGSAFLGGELLYVNGRWCLNNVSGRFGMVENPPEDVFPVMNEVADQLCLVINRPEIRLQLPLANYLWYYYAIWDRGGSDLQRSILLLEDFITQMCKNQMDNKLVELVRGAVEKFKTTSAEANTELLLQYLTAQMEGKKIKINGPLLLRLKFISGQTNSRLNLDRVSKPFLTIRTDILVPPMPVAAEAAQPARQSRSPSPRRK